MPIRNSTAEFLIFAKEAGADTITVRFQDEMLWLTLNGLAELFDVDKSVVSRHLSNIYTERELVKTATVAKYATVQTEGARQVPRNLEYYNLEAIIAVGYRVNSRRATDFRRWATRVLRDFAIRGYVLDKELLENGKFLGEDYFDRLIEEMTCSTVRARFPRRLHRHMLSTNMKSFVCGKNLNTRTTSIGNLIGLKNRRRKTTIAPPTVSEYANPCR